jgi:alpha-beta hydrolase superfamily lysophospholipase
MRKTENLSNAGLELFFRSWRPSSAPRAVVVIVPGFNSHSGYYEWVAERLTARGLAVYAIDLRGRGQSEGERFYVARFEDYVSDVHGLVTVVRGREGALPVFILGHSAGGVVATLYAADHQAELAGLVCESFAFKVPAPDVALAVLKGLSHVAPHAHVLRLKNEDFSRDPVIVRQMNEDPLIADEKQPTQTIAEMVRADQRLEREFPNFTLPLLILHGTNDKATKPSGSQQFYDTAASKDKTIKLYDGGYHDLLNDTIRDQVMADVTGWIEARV